MNFLKRALTGMAVVALISVCLLLGRNLASYLCVCMLVACVLEFLTIMNKGKGLHSDICRTIVTALLLFLAITWNLGDSKSHFSGLYIALFLFVLLMLLAGALFRKSGTTVLDLAVSMMALVYIALPLSTIPVIGYLGGQLCGTGFNGLLPLTIFIFIWCNDVGAYCVGCTLGKHRLFPRISPKKSWEGSIGGAVLTIAVAIVLPLAMPDRFGFLNIWIWIATAVVTVIAGTFGDLTESMIKRELGIKDSGNALPGHGGFLDRFDSTLFAFPAVTALLYAILHYPLAS